MSTLEYSKNQGDGSSNSNLPSSSLAPVQSNNSHLLGFPKGEYALASEEGSKFRKRRRDLEKYELKSKRLQSYLNYDYRNILNLEIQQIVSKANQDDLYILQDSQVGSSIWTSAEKAYFFKALDSIGKDNVRDISARIGSKSELEVREYILVLQDKIRSRNRSSGLCTMVEIHSASEISDECCVMLERAAEALATYQEYDEAKNEIEKWDDLWLINKNICEELDQCKNDLQKLTYMEEFKPIANFFYLMNWIQLSERIFMNPTVGVSENWESLAEPEEFPGIRATAFEDFYSLAISITKRLVSATIFCTMSRMRARSAINPKRVDVTLQDVEAAIRTLGFTRNSDNFWIGCARRCKLSVVDDMKKSKDISLQNNTLDGEDSSAKNSILTYDEIERSMASNISSNPKSHDNNLVFFDQDHIYSKEVSISPLDSHIISQYSESDFATNSSDTNNESSTNSSAHEKVQSSNPLNMYNQAAENAEDLYINAIDMNSSREEENRLRKILGFKEHIENNCELTSQPVQNPPKFTRDSGQESDDWREKLEYYDEWETLDTRIRKGFFASDRENVLEVSKQVLPSKLANNQKDDFIQIVPNSNGNYHEPNLESTKYSYTGLTSDSEIHYDSSPECSISSGETIAQLRGLAVNFQPSSDNEDSY